MLMQHESLKKLARWDSTHLSQYNILLDGQTVENNSKNSKNNSNQGMNWICHGIGYSTNFLLPKYGKFEGDFKKTLVVIDAIYSLFIYLFAFEEEAVRGRAVDYFKCHDFQHGEFLLLLLSLIIVSKVKIISYLLKKLVAKN